MALSWVREGEGAGAAAGMPSAGRVVLLDADGVPVSLSTTESGATPQALPVTLETSESVIGATGADLDGDGDFDVLLSVQDDVRLRVVSMLAAVDGSFGEGPSITFEARGDAAQLQRFGDGSVDLLVRLDTGLLFEATSQGDGSFSVPELSAWAAEPITGFGVGRLDNGDDEDLAVALFGPGDGESNLVVLLVSGQLPVIAIGSATRSLHVDALQSWILTIDRSREGTTEIERIFSSVNATPDPLLVFDGEAAVVGTTVTDLDANGRSDVVLLHDDGHLTVVFQAATGDVCTAPIETGSVPQTMHRPGTGSRVGLVLTGPDGVLAIGPTEG